MCEAPLDTSLEHDSEAPKHRSNGWLVRTARRFGYLWCLKAFDFFFFFLACLDADAVVKLMIIMMTVACDDGNIDYGMKMRLVELLIFFTNTSRGR